MNEEIIIEHITTAMNNNSEKVAEYRAGKKALLGLFVGEVMKLSKGKADPKLVNKLVIEKLEQNTPH